MALRRINSLDRYFTQLRSDSAELNALYEDVLINVTEFFRDPEVFDTLKKFVFPKIVAARNDNALRIWVPGCASGEEVYSIAIALLEFLGERSNQVPIQIFGTDISDTALERARSASYYSRFGGRNFVGTLAPVLYENGLNLRRRQAHSRNVRLREAKFNQGPAVLKNRPHKLPERHDLSGPRPSETPDPDFLLRVETHWIPPARNIGDDRQFGAVFGGG